MYVPYVLETNNTSASDLEPLVIPYQANQPVDPQLQNDNFCSIFYLG